MPLISKLFRFKSNAKSHILSQWIVEQVINQMHASTCRSRVVHILFVEIQYKYHNWEQNNSTRNMKFKQMETMTKAMIISDKTFAVI